MTLAKISLKCILKNKHITRFTISNGTKDYKFKIKVLLALQVSLKNQISRKLEY